MLEPFPGFITTDGQKQTAGIQWPCGSYLAPKYSTSQAANRVRLIIAWAFRIVINVLEVGVMTHLADRRIPSRGRCGGLHENDSHRLIYLNAWPTAGRTVWEGLGDAVVSLEEVCRWGSRLWGLKSLPHFQLAGTFPASDFYLQKMMWALGYHCSTVPACLCLLSRTRLIVTDSNHLEARTPINSCVCKLLWPWCLSTGKKQTNKQRTERKAKSPLGAVLKEMDEHLIPHPRETSLILPLLPLDSP